MNRLILVTILITVVYSWEDLKQTLRFLVKRFLRQNYNPAAPNDIDEIVGTALILTTLPINLVFLLIADGSLLGKLLVMLTEFLGIGLFAELIAYFDGKFSGQSGQTTSSLIASLVIGAVSPVGRVFGVILSNTKLFGSYLKHLAFPLLFGVILKLLVDRLGTGAVAANTDPLIIIAISALLINITIDYLEKFFRRSRLPIFSYFRIVMGIVIIAYLSLPAIK